MIYSAHYVMLSVRTSPLNDTQVSRFAPIAELSTIGWFRPLILYCRHMNETPSNNPYVNNLVEMGYDRADCEMVAAAGLDATYPRVIHGRTFDTKAEYDEALADYLNGLWQLI